MTKHTPTKRNLAVITGADGGMGREITLAVAAKGYTVVMVCQNEVKQNRNVGKSSPVQETNP